MKKEEPTFVLYNQEFEALREENVALRKAIEEMVEGMDALAKDLRAALGPR